VHCPEVIIREFFFRFAVEKRKSSVRHRFQSACRKWTLSIHSSHHLGRSEAKRFRVKLPNLKIPKIDLVKVFLDLLEAENLHSKDLANEHPAFVQADVAAVVVDSPELKSLRMNVLD
jgi:hypothetical protein